VSCICALSHDNAVTLTVLHKVNALHSEKSCRCTSFLTIWSSVKIQLCRIQGWEALHFPTVLHSLPSLVLRFGGGPAVNHLYVCSICQVEIEALAKRRRIEIDTFIKVCMGGIRRQWKRVEVGNGGLLWTGSGKLLPLFSSI